MELFYRLMGMTAWLAERGSRNRVNGIGANWWVLAGLAVFTGIAIAQVVEGLNNRGNPAVLPLETILAGEGMIDRYVTVSGTPDLAGTVARDTGKDDTSDPEEVYIPLVDDKAGKALYMMVRSDQAEALLKGTASGMLRRLKGDFKTYVSKNAPESGGIRIDERIVLVAGEKPAGLWVWTSVALAIGVLTLLTALAIAMRYVIFRVMPAPAPSRFPPAPTAPDAPPLPMRASGIFVFDQKDRRRFLDVPVALAEMESNDPALVTNLNASESFMGQVTRNLAGLWAVVMKAGTLKPPQYGRLYSGRSSRPALRVAYEDAINGKPSKVVLSFDHDADRDRAATSLRQLAQS